MSKKLYPSPVVCGNIRIEIEELDKFAELLTGLANPLVRKKIAPPDWGCWGRQKLVKLWQAVALSLDIDPDRFMPDSSYSTDKVLVLVDNVGPAIFAIIERQGHEWFADNQEIERPGHEWSADNQDRVLQFRKEIYRRLDVLADNRNELDLFPNSGDGDKVRLSEFVAWALSIEWDIPQELVAVAGKDGGGEMTDLPEGTIRVKVPDGGFEIPRRFIPPTGENLKKAQELAERERRGTIRDAESILHEETGEFLHIERAVREGEISSYAPGSCKPLIDPKIRESDALGDEEVYADELNAWLDKNFPRVKFRFPIVGDGQILKKEPINAGEIPGKLPNITVGKLAIKAAWELEAEFKRAASSIEVITRLQKWADDGIAPAVLIKSNKPKRGVIWHTKKAKEKLYDVDACGKALESWMKSRA